MHPAARVRGLLARHPYVYWLTVALLAAAIGLAARDRLAALDRARDAWGATRTVLVAQADHHPGDDLRVAAVDLPAAAVPASALDTLPDVAVLRHGIAAGEIVVASDVAAVPGPAAGADPGQAVVGVSDPLASAGAVGAAVQVVADGVVLADDGVIVDVTEDVTFVAVAAARAPAVAAAAQQRLAALVYLP